MSEIRKPVIKAIIAALSFAMCVFHLYTAATIPLQPIPQRSLHLGFALALIFLWAAMDQEKRILRVLDYILAIVGVAVNLYVFIDWENMMYRSITMPTIDYIMAIMAILVIMEAARRLTGMALPLVAIVFCVYAYLGPLMPGILKFSGISLKRFIASLYFGTEGIYGVCLSASATFAFMFILYAEFLLQLGAGDFLINISYALFGRVRGGPGKIGVAASGLFGMVSGSSVANVAGTGSLTIPLMKESGFEAEYSGGVVAAAAAGGCFMPPVMGAGAFIMAEMVGVPYSKIAIAAFLPACLYFVALFTMVDLRAAKNNLRGMTREEIPNTKKVLRDGWHYTISIIVLLILLIVLEWSATKSAFWSIIVLVASDWIRKLVTKQSIDFRHFLTIFRSGCKSALVVAASTACAGIIIGVFSATSLNLRFSDVLVAAAGGSLPLLLILCAIGALVLGMGLPATSIYIILSVLVAPTLVNMGIPVLAAHLFIFYFGCMAPVTPPVGVAFFVASGIAKSNPMKTGLAAAKTAIVGFLIPFVFCYEQALFLEGPIPTIIITALTTTIGSVALAIGLEGYLFTRTGVIIRTLFIVGGVLAIIPEAMTDIVGFGLIVLLVAVQYIRNKAEKKLPNDMHK